MAIEVKPGVPDDIVDLEDLWISMVEHHRSLVGELWAVRPADEAWSQCEQLYRQWLADGTGLLFVARDSDLGAAVGYAFCVLSGSGRTFDFGAEQAEVDSLVVADAVRGAGVGTSLMEACRTELHRRGIRYWSVGVVDANTRAIALYERLGFRSFTRSMVRTTDDEM